MVKLSANDCSPFIDGKGNFFQNGDNDVMKWLLSFDMANAQDDDSNYIVQYGSFPIAGQYKTGWTAGRYIGVAKKGGTIINIFPRFGRDVLMAMVEDVYNIKYYNHDSSPRKDNQWYSSLLNLIRKRQWLQLFGKAYRYGLPFHTIRNSATGYHIHGHININKTISPWNSRRMVNSDYFDKKLDDNICHIVYRAYRILFGNNDLEAVPALSGTISTLATNYKDKAFRLTEPEYKRIRYKSIFNEWKPLVDYSWQVIKQRSLGYDSSVGSNSQCVFVDMAEIWESFLRVNLGKKLADSGWKAWSVKDCTFKVYDNQFFGRKIIPDLIFHNEESGKFMVLDAKYKKMANRKADVDRADFFQIHAYIQYIKERFGSDNVVAGGLLYPFAQQEGGFRYSVSSNLYGLENSESPTKFIIDGIELKETDQSEAADNNQNPNDKRNELDSKVSELSERILSHVHV